MSKRSHLPATDDCACCIFPLGNIGRYIGSDHLDKTLAVTGKGKVCADEFIFDKKTKNRTFCELDKLSSIRKPDIGCIAENGGGH